MRISVLPVKVPVGKRTYRRFEWRIRAVFARLHLRSAWSPNLFWLLLFDLIYLNHVINLFDHAHLVWDHFFKLLNLLRLLSLHNLTTRCLSKHEVRGVLLVQGVRSAAVFTTCGSSRQKVDFVYIHRSRWLVWQWRCRFWAKRIVCRWWPCDDVRLSRVVLLLPILLEIASCIGWFEFGGLICVKVIKNHGSFFDHFSAQDVPTWIVHRVCIIMENLDGWACLLGLSRRYSTAQRRAMSRFGIVMFWRQDCGQLIGCLGKVDNSRSCLAWGRHERVWVVESVA